MPGDAPQWPWPKDHPLTRAMNWATKDPFSHWDNGWPQAVSVRWPGRGLAGEIGFRAYAALQNEKLGWWPRILDDFEELVGEL